MAQLVYEGQLTVAKLIKQLRNMPQDTLVWHEGCDEEWGASSGVRIDEGMVLITRCN